MNNNSDGKLNRLNPVLTFAGYYNWNDTHFFLKVNLSLGVIENRLVNKRVNMISIA